VDIHVLQVQAREDGSYASGCHALALKNSAATMSGSTTVGALREGLKDVLLGPAQLYEALRRASSRWWRVIWRRLRFQFGGVHQP
jgi:hypothetical protein